LPIGSGTLAPGPDNIFVLTQAALRGRLAGIIITLGLCTGLIVHTLAVALGIATIFQASAVTFITLKIIGAAYLFYLAWQSFQASAANIDNRGKWDLTFWQLYRRGIIMNITNPKVALFFLAFLPQFADPIQGPLALQIVLLGLVFMVATLLVFGAVSAAAGFLGERLRRSPRAQVVLNRIAGVILAGLAINLALVHGH
jgi:threonine/homoserine/homoserine lactone efflux protein